MQELLIGKSPLVVFQTDEFGVGDGGELAEAQIHTHDERDHKPDDERGERWQREERWATSGCCCSGGNSIPQRNHPQHCFLFLQCLHQS